jgi:glutamate dehydrogenase
VLDGLVVRAGLSWREVDVIRGYSRYLRQLQLKVVPTRIREILLSKPAACADLVALFKARFDPSLPDQDREAAVARCSESVHEQLRKIRARDEDLVFRTLARLVDATLRTNFYRTDRPFHYLSFKFDVRNSRAHTGASHLFEIYVHNKDVEGVHLRFGPVARGGLRWSDRDDFRTEVLGLATTQQKKNVVIVPEGSKGGFYLRNPSPDAATRRKEADRLYKTFIRGLLDLTDNAAGGVRTRPPGVVCHDGFDPYLVVAADKGTAHLSDTANGLSQEYGFWLGDAFASGGSNGYDHKAVGITARGGWVLVKRHFAEMGVNPYTQEFSCVGIGDMGGDVFGNGLVESQHTRLLAAFNHVHIFLDPNPDAAASYTERLRMFKVAGREAGWDHYNPSLISEGGGVFERSAKTIPLSPAARAMLGIDADEAPPNVVINHILKMKVDLLWNGGIGTYVKASFETDADADDSSNDELRVSANELRCRIVGEGGNLGFTQMARIEAGLNGVRLNTDAIDNSGGVDLSDHEVNLKILLSRVVGDGRLTLDARNELLEALTDEVATLVLANNEAQGRQLSRDQIRSRLDIYQFAHAITFIEKKFGIKRESLDLPTPTVLAERAKAGVGLTRPELAVLGAYVKMYVYTQLMAGDPAAIPGFDDMLVSYFPKRIQELYPQDIRGHMLAKEIAMTVATTRIVADAGAANIPLLVETTGASVTSIVTALFRAQSLARMDQVRATLEELKPTTSLPALSEAFVRIMEGARMVALDWLSARGRVPSDAELAAMIPAIDRYYELLPPESFKAARARVAELLREDIPESAALFAVKARFLNLALLAHSVATTTGSDLASAIVKVQAIGNHTGLLPVVEDLAVRPAHGNWEPIALRILFIRFLQVLRQALDRAPADRTAEESVFMDVRRQVSELLDGEERPSPATLLVLEERAAAAIARI